MKITKKSKLAVLMALVIAMVAFGAANASEFSDVTDHWAEDAIDVWAIKGLIEGYPDDTFKPENNIKRAEFFTLVNRIFGYVEKGEVNFSDVSDKDWYFDEIAKAVAAGYVSGYPDGTIRPDAYITREEAAKVVFEAFDLSDVTSDAASEFNDASDIADWAKNYVSVLKDKGYISGYPDGTFRPKNNIKRSEAVTMLANASGYVYNVAGTYSEDQEGNLVVNVADVVLENMTIEGNLYLAEGIGEGDVVLEGVTVKGDTFINGGGEDSIHVRNSTLRIVRVNKPSGQVRIVASGSTNVESVQVKSGAKVEQSEDLTEGGFGEVIVFVPEGAKVEFTGNFERVSVESPGVTVQVNSGSINEFEVGETATGASIALAVEATVNTMTINAESAVSGEGKIEKAKVNVSGTTIEQTPNEVEVGEGVSASIGGEEVGEEPSPEPEPTPSPGPAPGPGPSPDPVVEKPKITSISGGVIDGNTITLPFEEIERDSRMVVSKDSNLSLIVAGQGPIGYFDLIAGEENDILNTVLSVPYLSSHADVNLTVIVDAWRNTTGLTKQSIYDATDFNKLFNTLKDSNSKEATFDKIDFSLFNEVLGQLTESEKQEILDELRVIREAARGDNYYSDFVDKMIVNIGLAVIAADLLNEELEVLEELINVLEIAEEDLEDPIKLLNEIRSRGFDELFEAVTEMDSEIQGAIAENIDLTIIFEEIRKFEADTRENIYGSIDFSKFFEIAKSIEDNETKNKIYNNAIELVSVISKDETIDREDILDAIDFEAIGRDNLFNWLSSIDSAEGDIRVNATLIDKNNDQNTNTYLIIITN